MARKRPLSNLGDSKDMSQDFLKLTDFIKSITEQRLRQAAVKAAAQQARKAAQAKGQFKPKPIGTTKPVKLSF